MGPLVAHGLSAPAAPNCWPGARNSATASISGRDMPFAMGAITPLVSALTMSAGERKANSARVGARSTAGSWQLLQRELNTAPPFSALVALSWAMRAPPSTSVTTALAPMQIRLLLIETHSQSEFYLGKSNPS